MPDDFKFAHLTRTVPPHYLEKSKNFVFQVITHMSVRMLTLLLNKTGEKVFSVAPPMNPQNDRVYAPATSKKRDISSDRLLRTRPTFSKSVMVSVAISMLGCTNLIFVEPGVKINGQYYRDVLLMQELLPAIRSIAGGVFVFQQDNAPAHRAYETVELLRVRHPSSSALTCGQLIVLSLIQWITVSGAKCRSVCTKHQSGMWRSCSSGWLRYGLSSSRASWMRRSNSGETD